MTRRPAPQLADLMTLAEVATTLGISRVTAWRTAEREGIEAAAVVGRATLYRRSDLHRFAIRATVGRPRGATTKKTAKS